MQFFRQYIAPFLVLLIFLFSLVVVSARIFISDDLAAPAPINNKTEDTTIVPEQNISLYFSQVREKT